MLLLIILSFAGFSLAVLGVGAIQSVAVTGRLVCNEKPATDVRLKLYGEELVFDDKLNEGRTNETGEFYISGSKTDASIIDPIVYIYHKCNYKWPCYRKMGIGIPNDFITEGNTPYKTFDIGAIELGGEFIGEGIGCFI